MDPTIATSVPATAVPIHFLNVEYFFYLIYQTIFGGQATVGGGISFAWLIPLLTNLWIVVTILAYLIALGFLAVLVYSTTRLYQVESEEAQKYATIGDAHHAQEVTEHHRWTHVRELIESSSPNDWRQAIIEADIILDDMLTRLGYLGSSIGEKLKAADPSHFRTLQEAWEAHKVRNEIAHQGSAYPLTDQIAYRTILQYENVFREHHEI